MFAFVVGKFLMQLLLWRLTLSMILFNTFPSVPQHGDTLVLIDFALIISHHFSSTYSLGLIHSLTSSDVFFVVVSFSSNKFFFSQFSRHISSSSFCIYILLLFSVSGSNTFSHSLSHSFIYFLVFLVNAVNKNLCCRLHFPLTHE